MDSADEFVLRMCLVSREAGCSWEIDQRGNDCMGFQLLLHHIAPFAHCMSDKPVMRAVGQDRVRLRPPSCHHVQVEKGLVKTGITW